MLDAGFVFEVRKSAGTKRRFQAISAASSAAAATTEDSSDEVDEPTQNHGTRNDYESSARHNVDSPYAALRNACSSWL